MPKDHKYEDTVENRLASIVLDEFNTFSSGRMIENADFEATLDMMECKRTDKDYEWMSDVFLPELPSIILTDASGWANQYFQSRDFVSAKLSSTTKGAKEKADAASTVINQTLNRRGLYHYQKYIRARTINALAGQVYVLCEWQKSTKMVPDGVVRRMKPLDIDIEGNPMMNPDMQTPAYHTVEEPREKKIIEADWFNYEVIDPRNVATDNHYSYSMQQKNWVTVRYTDTYENLLSKTDELELFNLDLLKDINPPEESETAKKTFNNLEPRNTSSLTPTKDIDLYLRIGKMWAIISEVDSDGEPLNIKPGISDTGDPLPAAELIETFMTIASVNGRNILIRFQPNPYRDGTGKAYKPIVRGWCYIHPTKDIGLSDGKYGRELQIALNDTMNMSIDRVKLATMPTFIGRRNSIDDASEFFIEPEHVIQVENINEDLKELKVSDNIQGALAQIGMLKNFSEQVMSVYPTTMGQLPEMSSTTATAVAGADTRTNARSNYKSLTFEYTFFADFYWMILQMTYQFMEPETAIKMLGDSAKNFDPNEDYTYSPVSSNIETEFNKYKKLQIIDQFVGRVANVQNPNTPKLLNYLLKMAFELFDKDFPDYKEYMLDENAPAAPAGNAPANDKGMPMSNQNNQAMSMQEQYTRGGM
jgi:hypothetical protein